METKNKRTKSRENSIRFAPTMTEKKVSKRNYRHTSPISGQASPGKLTEKESSFGFNSLVSNKTQKIVSVDDKKLKKINDNLSQLCRELDIDETEVEINVLRPVSSLLLETSSVRSQPPIVLQAMRRSPSSRKTSVERVNSYINDKKVLETPLSIGN